MVPLRTLGDHHNWEAGPRCPWEILQSNQIEKEVGFFYETTTMLSRYAQEVAGSHAP